MKQLTAACVGTALVIASGMSVNANANTVRYEGTYVMEQGCTSFSVGAGIGLVTIDPTVQSGEITFDAVEQSVARSFTISCDTLTIDQAEVEAFENDVEAFCNGFQIPWQTQAQREEFCAEFSVGAVESLQDVSDYLLQQLVHSVDVDILNDTWIGGFGEMDYLFVNGTTEHRGPNVWVWNSGRYYRGFTADADTPNPIGCPSQMVARTDVDMDLSSSFGGGARMYLDTTIIDGVACPVADLVNGNVLIAGYGFNINIKQKGDRQ